MIRDGFLCCDFDGTLTNPQGHLTSDWFTLMELMRQRQLQLIIVSGRPQAWGLFFNAHLPSLSPLTAAIMENGAVLIRPEERHCLMPPHLQERLKAWNEQLPILFPELKPSLDNIGRMTDLAFELPMTSTLMSQLQSWVTAQGGQTVTSSIHLHVTPWVWDKAQGIKHYVEHYLKLPLTDFLKSALYVGDALNDESCFKLFPQHLFVGESDAQLALQAHGVKFAAISAQPGIAGILEAFRDR